MEKASLHTVWGKASVHYENVYLFVRTVVEERKKEKTLQ
jgi:hypothetical protein